MQQLDDDSLVEEYRKGKTEAFEMLYTRHAPRLFTYLLTLVRERGAAEDLLQESFIRLIRSLPRYKEQGKFKAFLYRVATNLARDRFRKRESKEETLGEMEGGDRSGGITVDASMGPPPESVGEHLVRREEEEQLRSAIRSLPEAQRKVIFLKIYSGLTFREIAEILNCPLNTVLGRMHYALSHLRKELGSREATQGGVTHGES